MRIGALVADGERTDLDRFDKLGFFMGTAFQIQDDVLNLIGDRRYGKEIGGDLMEGKANATARPRARPCESGGSCVDWELLGETT